MAGLKMIHLRRRQADQTMTRLRNKSLTDQTMIKPSNKRLTSQNIIFKLKETDTLQQTNGTTAKQTYWDIWHQTKPDAKPTTKEQSETDSKTTRSGTATRPEVES